VLVKSLVFLAEREVLIRFEDGEELLSPITNEINHLARELARAAKDASEEREKLERREPLRFRP
jgi:virulence-associated protein VagC